MKKNLLMLVSSFMAMSAVNAQEVATVPFTTAQINVPARVRFVRGNDYSFSVESENTGIASQLQCEVKDGTLNFKFGKALEPGTVVFDEKNDTYFYGVEVAALPQDDSYDEDNLMVITVTAPGMPEFKTSKDYKAFPVKTDYVASQENLAFNNAK